MPRELIPPDATIADVLRTLAHPEEYVRGVVSTMTRLRREYGDVVVRIGIRGTGYQPNYRVDHRGEPSRPIQAFDGANNQPFEGVANIDTENWSTISMTYDEVRALLGRLRETGRG